VKIFVACFTAFASFVVFAAHSITTQDVQNLGIVQTVKVDEHNTITIYLPDGYQQDKNNYPVIYVMDAQRYFLHAIAYQKTLVWQDKAPAFIVVGINTEDINRRELLDTKSSTFIATMQNDIVKYVDSHYRTNDLRMFFAWEMAGGFASELLATQPELFDAYFLASATFITESRLNLIKELFAKKPNVSGFLYCSLGAVESWSFESHQLLSNILNASATSAFKWKYNLSEHDDHYTTPLGTFNKGIAYYFQDYPPLRFYSLEEFKNFGGMKALKKHYENRGMHYQISTDIHKQTKHYLINQAINETNFVIFKELVHEFDDFIEKNNYRPAFLTKIGSFFVANGASDRAISLYKTGILENPDSDELNVELGDIYLRQNKFKEAKTHYKIAMSLVKDSDAEKYKLYKSRLINVN
jgi:predicted alpha/beta superfamily hydrolase